MIPAFRGVFEELTYEEVDIVWGEYQIRMQHPKQYGLNMDGPAFWKYCVENDIHTHDLLRGLVTIQIALLIKILRM